MSEIDALVAARKIRAAIQELLDGAESHLEEIKGTDHSPNEDEEDERQAEIDSTEKVCNALSDVIESFDSTILPELAQ